jgi:hypothetical protein
MDTMQQLSEAARRLTPDELRARLAAMDQEARVIRALLRATLRGDSPIGLSRGKPASAGEGDGR